MIAAKTVDPIAWPAPGEKWQHSEGHYYLVTGVAVHADTQETMVVCRSCSPQNTSIAYPLAQFLGPSQADSRKAQFVRVDSD